jgi:hypothetical protein
VKLPPQFKSLAVKQIREAITGQCRSDIGEFTLALLIVEALEAADWCLVPPGGPEWDPAQYGHHVGAHIEVTDGHLP